MHILYLMGLRNMPKIPLRPEKLADILHFELRNSSMLYLLCFRSSAPKTNCLKKIKAFVKNLAFLTKKRFLFLVSFFNIIEFRNSKFKYLNSSLFIYSMSDAI